MAKAKLNPDLKPVVEHADLTAARAVVLAEAEGLRVLADILDNHFVRAVDVIHKMRQNKQGRLIVSGIGKSGHVAKKMVATFASTGVPAHFVHVAEAGHGDLGMITEADVVILISASGESREQSDLIAYTRRFNIPLIAITRKADSTLGKAADIILRLPNVAEAFSDVVAPTTSTINTMAMGDALAEALMKRVGLTPDQFRVFHPAGKLGAQLMKVSDLMIKGAALPTVSPTTTMAKAILTMTQKNVGALIVIDKKGGLLGIVTDGDLKRHMGPRLLAKKVTDVMTAKPKTIAADDLAATAINRMLRPGKGHVITSLVVVDDRGVVKGMIRVQECLQAGLL